MPRQSSWWLLVAALLGVVHAAFSLYWSAGGSWLVWSLGCRLLATFAGWEWVLAPVGLVKLVAAVAPVILAVRGWPWRSFTRAGCWLGAAVLIVWGGANTVIGNLVLASVIRPESGYDRAGMIGHAYLWDPLFLLWGGCLAAGLVATRRGRRR